MIHIFLNKITIKALRENKNPHILFKKKNACDKRNHIQIPLALLRLHQMHF